MQHRLDTYAGQTGLKREGGEGGGDGSGGEG